MRRAGEEANVRSQLIAKRSKPKLESTQNKQLRAKQGQSIASLPRISLQPSAQKCKKATFQEKSRYKERTFNTHNTTGVQPNYIWQTNDTHKNVS